MTIIQRKKKEEIAPNAFRIENREYDNPPSIQAKAFSIMPMVKWGNHGHLSVPAKRGSGVS